MATWNIGHTPTHTHARAHTHTQRERERERERENTHTSAHTHTSRYCSYHTYALCNIQELIVSYPDYFVSFKLEVLVGNRASDNAQSHKTKHRIPIPNDLLWDE